MAFIYPHIIKVLNPFFEKYQKIIIGSAHNINIKTNASDVNT